MINYKDPVIVLAGVTASGKSSLALKLAKDFNGYVINADSRQVYKELKIGTAQPTPDHIDNDVWYIDGIRHYLYGHVSAKERYNLFQYQKDVQEILNKEEGIPILVGGTGLYIDCIVHNYILQNNSKNNTKHSKEELEKMNVKKLQSLLEPKILDKLNESDISNPPRLIRAIQRGGINQKKASILNYIYLLIDINSESLSNRINQRVDSMIKSGLKEENGALIKNGFTYDMSSMQSIGYQEFNGYFEGEKSIEEVKDEIVIHTLQYAKRQRTWFKRNKDIVKVKNYKDIYTSVTNFLSIS